MNENLAKSRIVDLGHGSTPQGERLEPTRRVERVVEKVKSRPGRVLSDVLDRLDRARAGPLESRLPAAEPPSPPKVARDLFVRDELLGLRLAAALGDSLEDVQVVENVVERAVVGKLVQKLADYLLRLHARGR
jgi:hypothetical protein